MSRKIFKPSGADGPAGWAPVDPQAALRGLAVGWDELDPVFEKAPLLSGLRALPVGRQAFLVKVAWQLNGVPLSVKQPDGRVDAETMEALSLRLGRIRKELMASPLEFGPLLVLMLRVDATWMHWQFYRVQFAMTLLSPPSEREALTSLVRAPGIRRGELGDLGPRIAELGGLPSSDVPEFVELLSRTQDGHRGSVAGALASAGPDDAAYRALLPLLDDDLLRDHALRAIIRRTPDDAALRSTLRELYEFRPSLLMAEAIAAAGDAFGRKEAKKWERRLRYV